ncbi:tetraspanin-33 isoform X2 [Anguilla anguilla]|uniref:tetraspanin-33 isoform X2 n=1 Tax=Anguilla anguilla TaxID=7936 RepID=UPI0015B0ACC7|nr:tetraspanin-33 isoform X2 [Anguilla anguilla]
MGKPKNCCQCVIKYTLFIFCYLFWVTSAVFIAVGVYAKIAKEGGVVDSLTADPALLLISIGSLMFIITFFGCFGALRNAVLLLKLFLGILVAILLLQVAAAVLGFLFSDLVLHRTEQLMRKGIVRYREDMDLENLIDFVQKKFQCCGVDSHKDWSGNVYFQCPARNHSLEGCGVPFSCCVRHKNEVRPQQGYIYKETRSNYSLPSCSSSHQVEKCTNAVVLVSRVHAGWYAVCSQTIFNTMCGYEMQTLDEASAAKIIYTTGCLEKIVLWGKQNLYFIGGMAVGLLGLEVSLSFHPGMLFSHFHLLL